jgi:hypothetical protein
MTDSAKLFRVTLEVADLELRPSSTPTCSASKASATPEPGTTSIADA